MEFFKKVKKTLIGETNDGKSSYLTAGELLDAIFSAFKERLQEETTSEFLLYPTCFYVYLHQSDYDKRKETFGHIVKAVVERFHRYIRKKMLSYPGYKPHATFWRIRFLPYTEGMIMENSGNEIMARQKEPVIISMLYSADLSENNYGAENFVATRRDKSSLKKDRYNINRDALLGIDQEGGCFTVKFDTSFAAITNERHSLEKKAGAILTITGGTFFGVEEGKNKYYMTSNELHISGKNDDRTNMPIIKIDNDRVLNPHVQIKYFAGEELYKLAAFGPVKCSERTVPLSTGDNVLWVNLYNNSDIFINDEININFKINKKK